MAALPQRERRAPKPESLRTLRYRRSFPSASVVLRLERPGFRDAEVFGLFRRHLGQFRADFGEVQRGDLLIEVLGQRIDLLAVLARLGEELDLGERLVGERRGHHEQSWPVALPRFTRRPSERRMIFLPSGNSISSTCGFTLLHLKLRSAATWISESKWPMLQTIARSCMA